MKPPLSARLLVPAVAAILGACATGLLGGCTSSDSPTRTPPAVPPARPPEPTRTGCAAPVENGPMPEWARAGFTGDSRMPHVMGDRGDIVAAIFGYPLAASRSDGASNKILWVAKVPAPDGDLLIEAKLDGSDISATRRVPGGPGPSIIDLPRPGCWHLALTWPDHTDTLNLVYR